MVKKNGTCEFCGYTCATSQKLHEHLKRKNPCRPQNFIPVQVSMAEPEIFTSSAHTVPFLVKNLNDRKPGETVEQWSSRFQECKHLYNDLMQVDPEALTLQKPLDESAHSPEEDNFFIDPEIDHETGPQAQSKSTDTLEFQHLSNITGDHEENLVF
nr:12745_t:CDS:2 [Entrophospora candida]